MDRVHNFNGIVFSEWVPNSTNDHPLKQNAMSEKDTNKKGKGTSRGTGTGSAKPSNETTTTPTGTAIPGTTTTPEPGTSIKIPGIKVPDKDRGKTAGS
jgi:hypothetical protein